MHGSAASSRSIRLQLALRSCLSLLLRMLAARLRLVLICGWVRTCLRACASSLVRKLTLAAMRLEQKEYTLPAKRLVFEDMAGAGSESQKDEKIKALNAEVAELKNRMLTAMADVENLRTRMKKTAEEDKKFAVRSFAKGMSHNKPRPCPHVSCAIRHVYMYLTCTRVHCEHLCT